MDYGQLISDVAEGSLDVGADTQLQALRALHAVTKRVHASLDLTATLEAVAEGVVEAAGFGLAAVNLAEPNGDYVTVAVAGSDDLKRELLGTIGAAENWRELFRLSVRWGSLYFVDHRTGVPESLYVYTPDVEASEDPAMWHPMDCLFAPLSAPSGEWLGVLSVDLPEGLRKPDAEQQEILALFAEHAAIAIQHARLHSALERSQAEAEYAATHDCLTGLANRALLKARADTLDGDHGQVGVLVVDLDGFKKVNDEAGHEAGDEVLVVIAERLRHHLRDSDVIARTGGDEFVAVLSGPGLADTLAGTAHRLRDALAEPIKGSTGLHRVGASVGWALGATGDDVTELIVQADHAMYEQKRRAHAAA
ncbi:sensor domain-containing diguanylate cyclase [Actinoplanes sp. N902-109]|uniref:sensor domain-containing diguanylate cyclase n=1 Tax=Actinoplanes sp. (strain N902-109) TaxID=649831 RepID=UPI00032941D1|nr:sensor domain-containing diguanylate cyclase [Actinoplanes sp. N902-109]AGL17820.1 PAS/PAC and GAF sensor-containing diguanylate cyclase [Actinoplanes sp. N902-109]